MHVMGVFHWLLSLLVPFCMLTLRSTNCLMFHLSKYAWCTFTSGKFFITEIASSFFRTSFCEIVPYPRIVRFTHCDFFKIRRTTASYLAKSNPPGNSSLLAKYEIAPPTIPNRSRIIDHFSGEILNYQDS